MADERNARQAASPKGRNGGPGRYRLHPSGPVVTRRRAGAARQSGRLKRLEGRFHLHPDVRAPGMVPITDARDRACADIRAQAVVGTISHDLADGYTKHLSSLANYAKARGLTFVGDIGVNLIVEWINAPGADGRLPSTNTRQIRRSAARAWFITLNCLGLDDRNPAKAIEEQRKYERYVHPLTDAQVAVLKDTARHRVDETRTPAGVALALLGASTGEIAEITVADVHLAERWVQAPGIASRLRGRRLPIDDEWAHTMLRLRVEALRREHGAAADGMSLTYQGKAPSVNKRTASTGNLLAEALKRARLHNPGVVRAASITEWVACRVFVQTGSLVEVANRLGFSSLDGVAHLVGLDWIADPTPLAPQPGGAT